MTVDRIEVTLWEGHKRHISYKENDIMLFAMKDRLKILFGDWKSVRWCPRIDLYSAVSKNNDDIKNKKREDEETK